MSAQYSLRGDKPWQAESGTMVEWGEANNIFFYGAKCSILLLLGLQDGLHRASSKSPLVVCRLLLPFFCFGTLVGRGDAVHVVSLPGAKWVPCPASSPGQSQSQWGPWDSPSDNIGFGMDSCCILPSFFLETMVCLPAANCWSSWSSTASCHVLVHCLWCPMDSLFWSMSFQLRTFQLPSGILIPPLSFPGSVLACLFSHLNAPVCLANISPTLWFISSFSWHYCLQNGCFWWSPVYQLFLFWHISFCLIIWCDHIYITIFAWTSIGE